MMTQTTVDTTSTTNQWEPKSNNQDIAYINTMN